MVEDDLGDSSVIMIRKTEKGSTERRSRLQSQLEGYTKHLGLSPSPPDIKHKFLD